MAEFLDHQQRLDYAKSCLQQLAVRAEPQEKMQLLGAANALGVAEERIFALEALVRGIAKKVDIQRADLGYPTGRELPETYLSELLRR
ncbi:hypothetical protein JQ633_12705 [Bradyrhizobium tropiciagri]|uniref:hypothetical protein n=1 Tax=Bradyrhizobium tropiciagri TaxID=312253 RepID=UPI001BAAC0C6|nr:hypothetical protein [Bradyrhizobium tropiciagri]MBR0871224.1 hypothetical protein [Bradyrhizobium tropiciagri]